MLSSEKPASARHLKDAMRHNHLDPTVLRQLYDKAMEPKFITKVNGYDCVLSTRTGSQDMPQLKLEMREGKKIQILCTHAVALYEGKKAVHWFDDLSHLCGIRQCLTHTVWELPWDNISRDGCHKYNYFETCPHQPPCVPEPPYHLVKAAIEGKQQAHEAAVANDPKKAKKRLQNAVVYARKKQRLEQKKKLNQDSKDEVVESNSDEEENQENTNPNSNTSSSSREHIMVE
jgi:hypothetical protein